jgi:adenylate cyclase
MVLTSLKLDGGIGDRGEVVLIMGGTARDGVGGYDRQQGDIEPAAVRVVLERILANPDFDAPERNRRFLRYVVEETLAGRGKRIKAYGIAVAVFDRDDSFDPQSDPIVRIEASRLRRSLERYYLLSGQSDPIRIEIPKGAYVPAFRRLPDTPTLPAPGPPARDDLPRNERLRLVWPSPRAARALGLVAVIIGLGGLVAALGLLRPAATPIAEVARQTADIRQGPAILVIPFVDDGDAAPHPNLSQGFTREVIAGLTRFSDLFVFGSETSFRYGATTDRPEETALDVDFVVTGGMAVLPGRFRVTASLIDAKSGQYLWSGKFEDNLAATQIIQVRDDLADRVVRELAQPYGVIFSAKASEIEGRAPQSFTSYECVLHFHKYWKTYDATLYDSARACLEKAIVDDNDYADAFASLAFIYADAYRFYPERGASASDPLARALQLARRAVELAPNSTHGYHALHLVYWLMNDVDSSLEAAEKGLTVNPNDTALMADLGQRYCLRGQWDKGLPLVRQAYARNPGQSGQYRIALFLNHYIKGEYEEALSEARKVRARGIIYNHVVLAIAYAKVGRTQEAAVEVARILEIDPDYGSHVTADLKKRNVHPDLIQAMVEGLIVSGLTVDESPRREASQASAKAPI